LGKYPHVKEFVDKHASGFSNLNVEYIGGMEPTLKMTTESDSVDTLLIDSWKTENVLEFLNEKLYH